jgi:hypothetical protein
VAVPELLPSTIDVVVRWVKQCPNLKELVGTNVSTTLPMDEKDMSFPWIQVTRIIGENLYAEMPIDRARLQFNIWGGTRSNGQPNWKPADDVVRALDAEIRAFRSVTIDDVVIEEMVGGEGIMQLQDPDTNSARFWMDAIVLTRNL